MKFLLLVLFLSPQIFLQITFEELDYIRSFSNNYISIIENGTKSCNKYFERNKFTNESRKYQNFYLCKFSKKEIAFIFICSLLKIKVINP